MAVKQLAAVALAIGLMTTPASSHFLDDLDATLCAAFGCSGETGHEPSTLASDDTVMLSPTGAFDPLPGDPLPAPDPFPDGFSFPDWDE